MNKLADEPAFGSTEGPYDGMTLRQHYAGLAMQGILASGNAQAFQNSSAAATWSVEFADALIAELERKPTA